MRRRVYQMALPLPLRSRGGQLVTQQLGTEGYQGCDYGCYLFSIPNRYYRRALVGPQPLLIAGVNTGRWRVPAQFILPIRQVPARAQARTSATRAICATEVPTQTSPTAVFPLGAI